MAIPADPAPFTSSDAAPASRKATTWSWLTLIGGAVMVLGSLLPWWTATAPGWGTVNRSGVDGGGGPGLTLLVIGVVIGVIGLRRLTGPLPGFFQRLPILGGALGLLTVQATLPGIHDMVARVPSSTIALTGPGLYVAALGSALALVGGLVTTRR